MRKAKLFMMLALLVMGVSNVFAQNVTVHPGNGSMLPALKSGNSDTFFRWGGFATWKHEQLSLTITTGDNDNNSGTDENGQLARPANDIFASSDGKYLQIGKGGYNGNVMDTYLTIALPKGYRLTGYTITFHRINGPTSEGAPTTGLELLQNAIYFGETSNNFTLTQESGTYQDNISYNGQGNYSQYTISRTSQTTTDMDNVLYFRLSGKGNSGRAFIQLDHVELYFTAENNYTPLIPSPNVTNQSAVDIPFTTSKMDYGNLTEQTDRGQNGNSPAVTRISYTGTIHDMNANLILYEDGSVKSVTSQQNDFDGTAGYMVDYKSGSISQAGDYFKLDGSKHNKLTNGEAIYYIESPIWAVNSASANAHKNPIGYRIIGAEFDYTGGNLKFPAVFKIQYESTGHSADQNGTYGLNFYNNSLAYNWNYQTEWRIDDDGYIYVGNTYLRVTTRTSFGTTTYTLTTTTNKSQATPFEITSSNQIRMKNNTSRYIGWSESGSGSNITRSVAIVTTNNRSTYTELSHAFAENIGSYTFNIYDKTGTRVEKTVTVNGNSGTLKIDGLNNDAVKIGVIGKGIIKGHIIMQALDPYIDRLDIVCQEQDGNGGKLTQQFNSTDFSVRGGKFTFYVPEDFRAPAKFTFENLYSQYGDNTYYNETSSTDHARYFFVGSTYGDTNANVYNRSESANYETKIACLKPGDKKFTFNNAATVTGSGGEFMENPFSKALYASKVNGSFNDFLFTQDEMNGGTTKTAYLFTCDETRYNIAPTTATQHVYYAYYEMTIDMQKKDYRPIFTWNPIYDETFYAADNSNIKRDPKWGLKVTTTETVDDNGGHSGYLTVSKILDVIQNGLSATDAQPAVQGLDATGENAPKTMDQILYIDGSNLMSIVENQTVSGTGESATYTSHKMSELIKDLGKNALIYLPYGSKPSSDNFAYNTIADYSKTPSFRGANDIVIEDRYPFYAPYDIQVDGAKMAKYERTLTNQALYGDNDQHLTIVLPFEINVDDEGVHTNEDTEGSPFTLATMNSSNSLSKNPDDKIDYYADGYFTKITEKSEPNKPYVVTMQGTAGESAFKVHVKGSLVKATPDKTGILEGESATGEFKVDNKTTNYSFTHKGTYTGIEIGEDGKGGAAEAETTVFYFANNYFLDSKTLSTGKSLKMLPFRSYYDYTGSGTGAGAKMTRFRIVFGENEENNSTNGINEVAKDADLAIIPGNGSITIMAKADKDVTIHAVNGMTVDKCNLRAGETRTVAMPAGIYVINGVKMIVK